MRVRALDIVGDWTFGKGVNDYLFKNDAIGQNIKTRLSSFLGDCFFDIQAGIDWFNLLGSRGAKNQLALELAISSTILNTENVSKLVELSVNVNDNRKMIVSYEVNTVYSDLGLTGPIVRETNYLLTESGDIITTEGGSPIVVT